MIRIIKKLFDKSYITISKIEKCNVFVKCIYILIFRYSLIIIRLSCYPYR